MTVAVAWKRKLKDCEELYFAADSRLQGNGFIWDYCKKIFILSNNSNVLVFSGATDIAFPLVQQIESAINSHDKSINKYIDVKDLKGHLINVINDFIDKIVIGVNIPNYKDIILSNIEFLFGGYSWISKGFYVWKIKYNNRIGRFTAHVHINPKANYKYVFCGDVELVANRRMKEKLYEIYGKHEFNKKLPNITLDMEPMEIVRDLIIEGTSQTIGGTLQMAKVYQHMNAAVIGVQWGKDSNRTVLGRKLLGYENIDLIVYDPFTKTNISIPYVINSTDKRKMKEEG